MNEIIEVQPTLKISFKLNRIQFNNGPRNYRRHRKRNGQTVTSQNGLDIAYDKLVLTTGSSPFVPSIPGVDKRGVFVYPTIEDLEGITEYAKHSKTAAVICTELEAQMKHLVDT